MSIEGTIEYFAATDDWDDRFRYIIDLGRSLPEMPAEIKNAVSKVRGCASQVWLVSRRDKDETGRDIIRFQGESDAMIVRGLIAILLQLYSGRTADEILSIDARRIFGELGLDTHLTQQRSNGLFAMVERIRADARALAAGS